MNMIKRFSLLAALVAVMFAFNACEEDSTGPSEEEIPNAPVNLKALAADASTVHLKWSAPGDLDDTMFDSYTVTYYPEGTGSTDAPTMDATEADMPFPVTGLDSNLVYTFDVVTNYTNGETSTVASINWAPAMRFEMNPNTAETIKLYEVDSDFGSGLQLFNSEKGAPEPLSVEFIEDWNIALYATDDMLMFGTPTELPFQDAASAINSAEISNFSDNVSGLNDVFESIDLENRTFSARSENLAMTSLDGEAGLVMYVRAPNGDTYNYAKVFIKGNGSGGFLQGTGDNEYVEVMISYQANAGFPYAKK